MAFRAASAEAAVSDTVGSVLLIGITVVMAVALGSMLFAFKGPEPIPQSNLSVTVSPGNAQWGTGDEQIRVVHNGGEKLLTDSTNIVFTVNGLVQPTVMGTGIGNNLYTGTTLLAPRTTWNIGQTWVRTLTLSATDTVSVNVITGANTGVTALIASAILVPGQVAASAACPFDTTAPTYTNFAHSPADVTKNAVTVSVSIDLADNCSGVQTTPPPNLYWGLQTSGSAPTYSAVAMSTQGLGTWTATIPYSGWSGDSGKILQLYVVAADVQGNTLTTATVPDVIDVNCTGGSVPDVASGDWVFTPLASTTTPGILSVQATITDCWPVDDASATPQLWFRFNDGLGSPPAFGQAGVMTRVGPAANHAWTGDIPSQNWFLQSGRTLEMRLQNLKDTNMPSPTGVSTTKGELIDLVPTTYIVASGFATPVVGTASNQAGATAQGAPVSEASLAEGNVQYSTLVGTANANPNSNSISTSGCALSPAQSCAWAADSGFAVMNGAGDILTVSGYPSPGAGTITHVIIGMIGKQASAGTGPTATLAYHVSGTLGATSLAIPTASWTTTNGQVAQLEITGDRAWTAADIQALTVKLTGTSFSNNAQVDQLWVKVSTVNAGGSGRALSEVLTFNQVPNQSPTGGSQTLQLGYRDSAATDAFNVWVLNPTANTYRVCPTPPDLTSTAASPGVAFTCTLQASEYSATGTIQVRITDVNPGSAATTLFLDYARIFTT